MGMNQELQHHFETALLKRLGKVGTDVQSHLREGRVSVAKAIDAVSFHCLGQDETEAMLTIFNVRKRHPGESLPIVERVLAQVRADMVAGGMRGAALEALMTQLKKEARVHSPVQIKESGAEGSQSVLAVVTGKIRKIWKNCMETINGEMQREDAIHPDFRMRHYVDEELTWYQNISWGPFPHPPYKLGFYFNDPSALNDCPWVCKFGRNLNKKIRGYRYFCVAYGLPELYRKGFGLEEMTQWVMQFDHPSLMKYDGTLVKMLKQENAQ